MSNGFETVPSVLDIPAAPTITHRVKGLAEAMHLEHDASANDNIRVINLFSGRYLHSPSATLVYLVIEEDSPPAERGWIFRGAQDPSLRSRWQQGFGRAAISACPDAKMILPTNQAVYDLFATGGEILVAHSLDGVRETADGQTYYEYLDALFNRVLVMSA